MKKENGIYTVPCKVNGLNLRFIFDTGASNVSISLSEAIFMLKNGYLDADDIAGFSKSQIADGNIVENTRIILRKIEIGGLTVNNVEAIVVHTMEAPLLLGQSAIQQLGKIQLDGNELVINKGNASYSHQGKTLPKEKSESTTAQYPASTPSGSWSSIPCSSEKWRVVGNYDDISVKVDICSIERTGNKIYVWTKTNYTTKESVYDYVKEHIDFIKEHYYYDREEKIKKWLNFDYTVTYSVYNIKSRKHQALAYICYSKDGSVIESAKWEEKESEYEKLVPGSVGMDIFNWISEKHVFLLKNKEYSLYIEDLEPFWDEYWKKYFNAQ